MARINPVLRENLRQFEETFKGMEKAGAVVPNSLLTMGWVPDLLEGFARLTSVVYRAGAVPAPLKRMVAHISSRAAGCRYCSAHNQDRAKLLDVSPEKLKEIWTFEGSALFSAKEKAALRFAMAAATNDVPDDVFADLVRNFTSAEIVELTAVVAMTGYTNRWNEVLGTDLEEAIVARVGAAVA